MLEITPTCIEVKETRYRMMTRDGIVDLSTSGPKVLGVANFVQTAAKLRWQPLLSDFTDIGVDTIERACDSDPADVEHGFAML